MQDDAEIGVLMYLDLAINPLYWDKSVKPVAGDSEITHILDFGPGKTTQRLSADTLKSMDCSTPILAAAVPKELAILTK